MNRVREKGIRRWSVQKGRRSLQVIKVAIRNVTLTAFAVAIGLCPQNCLVGQEEKSEGLWIGVLAADGGVVPIALSSDEIWQMP